LKLSAFTDAGLIDMAVAPGSKTQVLAHMARLISKSPDVTDEAGFLRDVVAREELVTTGVGDGVAFPHARSSFVRSVVFAFGRSTEGIDFDALDSNPVRLIFLVGAPRQAEPSRVYLNLMARLSFLMKHEENRKALLSCRSTEDALRILDSVD